MEQIKELYIKMYQYMIDKNKEGLESVLDDSFVLTHMTGLKQTKNVYIDSILDGTLNYYSAKHENIKVEIKENEARLIGDSFVEAKVFGGGNAYFRLRQSMNLVKKKSIIKMIIDILMFILMLLEYSKLYTGQLIHEVAGIALFVLFLTHNLLNINFYSGLLRGKYNLSRAIITTVDLLFLFCMIVTIALGIPISEKVFKFLNLNGNMTTRALHTILGYWDLILLSIHLGLHFKMIFARLRSKIKDDKKLKVLIYIIQLVAVVYGIKTMNDTSLGLYLIGKASFAVPTNVVSSIFNNFSIILSIAIITYNFEKIFLMKKRGKKSE